MQLKPHQKAALARMKNGCILWGGVGTGKTMTALAYYTEHESPKDLYVITTAKKRDAKDWVDEARHFVIGTEKGATMHGVMTVDSWNNISKYVDVKDAFFILDEQRLVGTGMWTKSFLKIAKRNNWIMLSATPGDTWLDYMPVFIANGFYRNITEFKQEHVVYSAHSKFPKVDRYIAQGRLVRLRKSILVHMPYERHTRRLIKPVKVSYDVDAMNLILKKRWNIYEERPIRNKAELLHLARRVSNSSPERLAVVRELMKIHKRLIIFYTFDYELEILRTLADEVPIAEWTGHKHEDIPDTERWVYLVQYTSGAEGWNCVTTNAMVFYSLTYSYKLFEQSQGRIDRLNTPYSELYYYVIMSNALIDLGIKRSLNMKENFNESAFEV